MEINKSADENSSRKDILIRFLFVILFAGIYIIAEMVIGALVIIQFGFKLITGEVNDKLLSFSKPMTRYIYEILQFVTFNEDEKPFPFDEWPDAK